MCGIAGIISNNGINYEVLHDMVKALHHRGPDETGHYLEDNVGLGHTRLSIIDPENGKQPAANEDESIVVIFNGEIYNFITLRNELLERGHILTNNSDTAILPHMFEEYGLDMFKKLNGQFAIALWVKKLKKLVLARDRLGEKPLYYHHKNSSLLFASEVKAILDSGMVNREISPASLKQVFTYWTTLSGFSIFEDIFQVPEGSYLVYENNRVLIKPYWKLSYSEGRNTKSLSTEDFIEELDYKFKNAVKTRMISDVPISFYLSGGLDSSLVTSIAARLTNKSLDTFSITFDDDNFDESQYQDYMSRHLETNHHRVSFSAQEIPRIIKDVIYHTEVPLLRSGAFSMYALAKLVRNNNTKVVLSGEGSDELFGGYDIFREVKIREFCSRYPESKYRANLYKKVNNFVKGLDSQPTGSLSMYYNSNETNALCSSHASRWKLGRFSQQFFSNEFRDKMREYDENKQIEELLPREFLTWSPVQRAQYLEAKIFFPNYLLSSQGDRVSMAASVECRYPFLDYEIVDFANSLPDTVKIRGLNEKYIIKKLALKYLPDMITKRKKFPYRAPINIAELKKDDYIGYMTSFEALEKYGIFNPHSTEKLLKSMLNKKAPNERDCMLFMGILTTQILYDEFIK